MTSPQCVRAARSLAQWTLAFFLFGSLADAQRPITRTKPPSEPPASTAATTRQPAASPDKGTDGADADTRSSAATTSKQAAIPSTPVPLQPAPAGFDIQARGQDVLAHLSAVIRYYRSALVPIQKVGEPSDLLYREQALTDAGQAAQYAFEAGRAEAVLMQGYAKRSGTVSGAPEGEAQRLQTLRSSVAERINTIKTEQKVVEGQLEHPRRAQVAALEQQKEQLDGALDLNTAMNDALGKIANMSDTQGHAGLAGDIERLQRTAPEIESIKTKPVVTAPIENLSAARSSGVSSQATVLFQLLGTRHALDTWISDTDSLHNQALALRTPLTNVVRDLVQRGQELSQQVQPAPAAGAKQATSAPASSLAQQLLAERQAFDSVTVTFKALSAASVPLTQEIITLEQTRANLMTWRAAVDTEYRTVLRALLLRVLVIALALGVVFVLGEVWRRATVRYVHDVRRRRQLLVMRRIVVSFLSGLVVIFGFVTQFNSLATFAGFITAGLAVGLQTILLSVAAYFFIVGRYGVRVGDRITIAGVTGDVIDVGLVRFYMMELAGSSTELHPTGRVAVFSNAVLFQAGTPLYKQMPGTEYAWHELTVKLAMTADYGNASAAMLQAIRSVYEGYRARIEGQHRAVESWMDTPIDAPKIDSRLQLVDDGLQFWVRFPVEIREAAAIDERVTQSLLQLMSGDAEVKSAVTSTPQIKAAVKG